MHKLYLAQIVAFLSGFILITSFSNVQPAPKREFRAGLPAADYKKIVDWWSKNNFERHLYRS